MLTAHAREARSRRGRGRSPRAVDALRPRARTRCADHTRSAKVARGSQVRLWSTRAILDRDGCDLLPERETQHRAVEEELGLERPFDGLGLAEAVALSLESQIREREALAS